MTIERDPGTFEHAIKAIMDHLGTEGVRQFAEAHGWSVSLIEKWSHPTIDRWPNVHQSLALDIAYIMAGGEGAPMHESHEAALGREVGREVACRRALAASIAEASAEMGDATAAAIMLTQPNASPHQVRRALREAEQALGAVGRMRRKISKFLSTGGQAPGEPNSEEETIFSTHSGHRLPPLPRTCHRLRLGRDRPAHARDPLPLR